MGPGLRRVGLEAVRAGGGGVIVKLPFPAADLFPNRSKGRHWTSTRDIREAQHDAGYKATQLAKEDAHWVEPEGNIPLSLLYLTPDKRHRDCDNMLAASKSLLDGMARALGVDDRRFKPVLVDWVLGPKHGALIAAVGIEIRSGVSL